jgi:CBS domain-containing protein
MLVKDVMTSHPVTVTPGTGIKAALTKLAYAGITSMPVVDDEQRLCGILSEADMITHVADDPRAHERPITIRPVNSPRTVDDVFTRSPITARPHDDVTAAVDVMAAKGFKSLPVVDDQDRLVGVISRSDVVRALARDDDAIARDISRIFGDLGHTEWTVQVAGGIVQVAGAGDAAQRSLAHALSRTVPGVVEVHVH